MADGIVSEIVNTAILLKKTASGGMSFGRVEKIFRRRVDNINRMAKKSIFYFPLLTTDSCDADLALKVRDSLEAQNANLIKLIISRIGLIDITSGEDKATVIDRIMNDGEADLAELDYAFNEETDFYKVPELEKLLSGKALNYNLDENGEEKIDLNMAPLNEISYRDRARIDRETYDHNANTDRETYDHNAGTDIASDMARSDIRRADEREKRKLEAKIEARRKQIGGTIVKVAPKANKKEPTNVEVDINVATQAGVADSKIVLGVKVPMRVIPSEEIIKYFPKAKFDTSFLIKLAKLTTGEIKFFRDFLFNVGAIKGGYNKQKAGTGKWFHKLKQMTNDNKVAKVFGGEVKPIFSMMLSIEDVENLYNTTRGRMDVLDRKIAGKIVESLSLINLIVIDEANEKILWFDESDNDFEVLGVKQLSDKNKSVDSKELMKVMLTMANR